ncbi:MAG: PIN domain-containing protein [Propionibacteriales bacterium]|nr:PIN domain-containing protein [Propionibacteriales bacterium]
MIVDTSAVIAILNDEPDARDLAKMLGSSDVRRLSAASYLETAIIIDRKRVAVASRKLDRFVATIDLAIEPVTPEQARVAREAYRDFGKGSGHPANLNFGDCFAYALAATLREPLLFKGNDFSHTDVIPAYVPT